MEPTKKSPEVESLINAFNPTGRNRVSSIQNNVCTWCGGEASEFKNSLSIREYTISGFCQKCQDETFGKDE